jgi:hypothetical protein
MKNTKILLIAAFVFISNYVFADGIPLQDGTELITTPPERAAELMTTEDGFTRGLSSFDLQSKTLTVGDVTMAQYLEYLKVRPQEWTYEDVEKLKRAAASISKKLNDLGMHPALPPIIEIIKSDMKEENGAAAYTRLNYIAMGAHLFKMEDEEFENVLIHEIFHVMSRNNLTLQNLAYELLGFKQCNEVAYPPEIHRISNPDAPYNNYYITVRNGDESADAMLVLYSDKKYEGGSFFRYAKLGLMVVEGDDRNKTVVYKDNKPVILQIDEVGNFYEQVGKNTGYIIHPEEVSADHFELILNGEKNIPNPELVEKLAQIIREN